MDTKANIKLIAMDMDGTLLSNRHEISKGNQRALQEASERGVHIAICSGRLCGDSSLFALDAGLDRCHIISLNGAYCLTQPMGEVYSEHLLPPVVFEQCLQVLSQYELTYGCFGQNRMVSIDGPHQRQKKLWGTHRDRAGAPLYFRGREALLAQLPQGFSKIVCMEDGDPQSLQEVWEKLSAIEGVELTSSWRDNLEVMPQGTSKGSAVRELAERLGISADQVMTLGDYENDISMLSYAKYGVAMGNASDAVKRAASYVTLDCTEDGVAEAIRRFVL